MSDPGLSDLADEIKRSDTQELALRLATVESIQTDTVTVRVAGSTNVASGVDYVGYAPKVGDVVLVFQNGPNLIIWGIPGTTGGIPTGSIIAFGSATPPPGYLLCNGQATTGFAALAAVVGGTVPDLRDKFILGAGNVSVGATGGVATQTNPPAHTHPIPEHGHTTLAHTHGQQVTAAISGGNGVRTDYASDFSGASAFPQGVSTDAGGAASTQNNPGFTSSSTGTSGGVENRPPFYALTYIIKT